MLIDHWQVRSICDLMIPAKPTHPSSHTYGVEVILSLFLYLYLYFVSQNLRGQEFAKILHPFNFHPFFLRFLLSNLWFSLSSCSRARSHRELHTVHHAPTKGKLARKQHQSMDADKISAHGWECFCTSSLLCNLICQSLLFFIPIKK